MKRIAICGAGICGIATAYYLLEQQKDLDIILIDKQDPLSYTSSVSGENFRDYWPHPVMEALSSRSIKLMKLLQAAFEKPTFNMAFSGYHFISHRAGEAIFADDSTHEFNERNIVTTSSAEINKKYPYLDANIQKSIFIKNAGHVDSITMANMLLRSCKDKGLKFFKGDIIDIIKKGSTFDIRFLSEEAVSCDKIILAPGPFLNHLADMIGIQFPIWNTLQRKFIVPDPMQLIPTDMPFTIYADPQKLNWTTDEFEQLREDDSTSWMTEELPGAIHIKPESGRIKMGWALSKKKADVKWTIPSAKYFPQLVLKAATKFIPALTSYEANIPSPLIEYGGYYTRTEENWPLIGPTKLDNAYVIGAMAGFGTMVACAAGELCAAHVLGTELPSYAPYFSPDRYLNEQICQDMNLMTSDGQL